MVQAVNEMRINAAVECLESGEYKIQEIAEMVGFSSSKYFISGLSEGSVKE